MFTVWTVAIYGTRAQSFLEDKQTIPVLKNKNKTAEAPDIPVLLIDWNESEKDTSSHRGFNKHFFF